MSPTSRKKLKYNSVLYTILCFILTLIPLFTDMGSSSSKSVAPAIAEMESAFADMFADAMERADWHGRRKPTWQQCRDEFAIRIKNAEAVA